MSLHHLHSLVSPGYQDIAELMCRNVPDLFSQANVPKFEIENLKFEVRIALVYVRLTKSGIITILR